MTTTAAAPATASTSVKSGTTPLPPGSSTTDLANSQIAGNFQSFLTLLTTQLQNQNPLSPLDTNQFTQQLVEFAGVQQQLNTNESLKTLISLQQVTQSTEALAFVGKTAIVNGKTATLTNNGAGWQLTVPSSGNVDITITNSAGQTVFTKTLPASAGKQIFGWDGKDNSGALQAKGSYSILATTKDASGKTVAIPTQVEGVVASVDLTQSPPLLTIDGQTYTVDQIQSIVASN
jgi:flagellar basal-body rod modification protein FlgD